MIGMQTFGQSAPFKDVEAHFGFTPDKIAEAAKEVIG
jgi:transketolase